MWFFLPVHRRAKKTTKKITPFSPRIFGEEGGRGMRGSGMSYVSAFGTGVCRVSDRGACTVITHSGALPYQLNGPAWAGISPGRA